MPSLCHRLHNGDSWSTEVSCCAMRRRRTEILQVRREAAYKSNGD